MSSDLTSIYYHRNINTVNSNDDGVYEFDRFRLETANRMLFEDNQPVQLAPKVVETLLALVRRGGEIISKEKLMNEVWADSFVEESNLTQHIYLLRKTLGKAADGRDLIETFRRRGYRFTGELKQRQTAARFAADDEFLGFADEPEQISVEKNHAPVVGSRKKYLLTAAFAGLLITAIFAVPRFFNLNAPTAQNYSAADSSPKIVKSTRLTPDINAYSASFTPDGEHLVYTLQEKGKESVWLKDLTTDAATQIQPPSDEGYFCPMISRDNYLYFMARRKDMPNNTLLRVSLAGGNREIVATDLTSSFTISPDEKNLAYINSKWQIMIADADAKSEPRFLARRDAKKNWYETWSSRLSFAPDGASVAVCGGRTENGKRIYELIEVSVSDGSERIIPTPENWNYLDDAVWLNDKSGLLVAARETVTAPFQIWRVAYPSGETRRVTNDTNDYSDLNISPDSRRLVVINNIGNLNLWLAPFDEISRVRQITFGTAAQNGRWGIAFSPNGKIIYNSPRGGNFDLWETNADGGSEQKQLTQKSGDWNGRPQTTRDGRYIVFSSTRSGATQIWRMDADGGNPKQLTNENFADEATLSAIGDAIYFTVKHGDDAQIYKTSIDGGEAIQITKPPINFFLPSVSPDGKLIFCMIHDSSSNAPWKSGLLNAETGELLKIFDFTFMAARWTADSKSVVYAVGDQNLRRVSIEENAKPQPITDFDNAKIAGFAISNDFKQIAFSRGDWTSEAVLLENF